MRARFQLIAAGTGLALMTGCVTTGTYKKLQANNNDLKAKSDQLSAQNDALQKQLADIKSQADDLAKQKADLEKSQEESKTNYDSVMGQLQQEVKDGELKITQYKNKLTVDVAEKIFFDSGSARLKEGGKTVLKKVATAMGQFPDKQIRIEGHTDNVPLAKSFQKVFPTNWELSAVRATNVVRFLQDECGVAPERLVAVGHGQYEPIATNTTPEGRQQNRRIEIVLQDKDATSPSSEVAPATPTAPAAQTPPVSPDASTTAPDSTPTGK